jgi:hypothetical protein
MRRISRKRPVDYILPFLVILGLGVIVILGFQLWKNFEKQSKADVYFYIVGGKAKVLPFGEATWENAFSGTKMLVGDSLKTSSIGKAVLVFFNGTMIRMGNDTALTLTDLVRQPDTEKIVMAMDNGMVWVNARKSPGVKEADYEVRTANMAVKATGTVFEVENGMTQTVRVIEGSVKVDVIVNTNGKDRVADTIDVGVGQEITLDVAALKAFEESQSPSVLMAISDQFKATEWYTWNIQEDKNPTSYDSYVGEVSAGGNTMMTQITDASSDTMQGGDASQTQDSGLTQDISLTQETQAGDVSASSTDAPVITAPDEDARAVDKGSPITITGTVPEGTKKVVVEQVINGKPDSYVLGKFKAGDTKFSYNVSEKLGNLLKGDNVYSFYAFNADGDKSDAAEVTITYNKPDVTITDALTAPKVLTFNGAESSVVKVDAVTVAGEIKGAEKVVVNDYVLSKFEPGSTSWSYSAKESVGNLKPGINEYEVYGVDADGNKSDVVKFTITYNKSGAATSQQSTSGAQSTQQTSTQQTSGAQQTGGQQTGASQTGGVKTPAQGF